LCYNTAISYTSDVVASRPHPVEGFGEAEPPRGGAPLQTSGEVWDAKPVSEIPLEGFGEA